LIDVSPGQEAVGGLLIIRVPLKAAAIIPPARLYEDEPEIPVADGGIYPVRELEALEDVPPPQAGPPTGSL